MIVEIILIIISIIIILLYLGIDLVGNFSKQSSKLEFSFKILLFKKIKIYSIDYPSKDKQEKEKDKKDHNRKITFELIKPCIGNFLEFAKSLFKTLNVRKLESHVDLGLSSYMETAKYVGYLWAFFVFPNTTLKNTTLTATPIFGERIIDFKGTVDVRINLLKLMIPIVKLILDKNVRKLIREAI